MDKPLSKPNLPAGAVSAAVIGEGHDRFYAPLESCGIKLFFSATNESIDKCGANHADMAAWLSPDGSVIADCAQTALISGLTEYGFSVIPTEQPVRGAYPADTALNCFILNDRLVCHARSVSPAVLDACCKHGISPLHVRQGYAKCSSLVVNENALITDDSSIQKACLAIGADCLLISRGDIYLDGVHEGFIGGASFMTDGRTAAFFGQLRYHRDCDRIVRFLDKHGIDFVEICDGRITDIGGVVPLLEKA